MLEYKLFILAPVVTAIIFPFKALVLSITVYESYYNSVSSAVSVCCSSNGVKTLRSRIRMTSIVIILSVFIGALTVKSFSIRHALFMRQFLPMVLSTTYFLSRIFLVSVKIIFLMFEILAHKNYLTK